MTPDQLSTAITYLQEETLIDPEMASAYQSVLEDLTAALNALHTAQERLAKAYEAALAVVPAGQSQSALATPQIQVVLNWFEELNQRVPTR